MTKCGKGCPACPYNKEGKSVKINNKEWKIYKSYDCNSYNLVYAGVGSHFVFKLKSFSSHYATSLGKGQNL